MTLVFESDLSEVKYMIPAHVAAATGNRPEKIIPAETGKLSSGDKFVLVALADNAADDGSSIYPSIETLVKKTQMSERGCQIALRHLEAAGINGEHPEGLLVLEHEEHTLWMAKGFLRKTRTYRLNVDLLATFRRPEVKKVEGAVSAGLVGGRGHQVRGGGGSECGVDPAVSAPDSSVVTVHRNYQKKQKHNPAPESGAAGQAVQVGGLLVDAEVLEAPVPPPRPAGGTHAAAAAPGQPDPAAPVATAPISPAAAAPGLRGHPAVALYCDRWTVHHGGTSPTITPKRVGILTRIYKKLGAAADAEYAKLLDTLFDSRDAFIVSNAHSPETFETKLDALRVNGHRPAMGNRGLARAGRESIDEKWEGQPVGAVTL